MLSNGLMLLLSLTRDAAAWTDEIQITSSTIIDHLLPVIYAYEYVVVPCLAHGCGWQASRALSAPGGANNAKITKVFFSFFFFFTTMVKAKDIKYRRVNEYLAG